MSHKSLRNETAATPAVDALQAIIAYLDRHHMETLHSSTQIIIAPGANINYKTGHAIFEATHGTAPNIAGKNVVNPCSIILSAVMMLGYFGWTEAAALIEKALENSFLEARATHDLARFMPNGTSLSTTDFTREIVERIEK